MAVLLTKTTDRLVKIGQALHETDAIERRCGSLGGRRIPVLVRGTADVGERDLSLAEIYDDAFFAEYGRENREYARAASFIGDEIHRRFQPRTVVDWGCGAGLHAGALARRGARVVGVDGVPVAARHRDPDVDYRVADLTRAVSPDLTFPEYDLSLCIDVLEHLGEADSGVALANVARGAALVILSCAPPGQGGHHHVNEQPRRYWVRRMAEIGWRYDRRETGRMEHFFRSHSEDIPISWMYHNLCLYRPG